MHCHITARLILSACNVIVMTNSDCLNYCFTIIFTGGQTYSPGVYCSLPETFLLSSYQILTLDAMGDVGAEFTFIAASCFTSLPYTIVQLINMASAGNVYWSIGSSATIGDYSTMVGNIIATASITFNSYSTLSGRGLAGAAITCASGSTLVLARQT